MSANEQKSSNTLFKAWITIALLLLLVISFNSHRAYLKLKEQQELSHQIQMMIFTNVSEMRGYLVCSTAQDKCIDSYELYTSDIVDYCTAESSCVFELAKSSDQECNLYSTNLDGDYKCLYVEPSYVEVLKKLAVLENDSEVVHLKKFRTQVIRKL